MVVAPSIIGLDELQFCSNLQYAFDFVNAMKPNDTRVFTHICQQHRVMAILNYG